jgi:hypothetical protein
MFTDGPFTNPADAAAEMRRREAAATPVRLRIAKVSFSLRMPSLRCAMKLPRDRGVSSVGFGIASIFSEDRRSGVRFWWGSRVSRRPKLL